MAVDNFDIIKPLLKWRDEDDFFFLQVIQRKKDAKAGTKVNGTNNNSRLIKAYYVKSEEQLDFIKPEIIELCKVFNARAGIDLNRKSFRKNAFQLQMHISKMMMNEHYNKMHKAYSSVVGKFNNENEKKWIIDLDTEEEKSPMFIAKLAEAIKFMQPEGEKAIVMIPSKSGYHLITKPFNRKEFGQMYPKIAVQDNNPTNLYIP